MDNRERAVAAVAARQHGVVTVADLAAAGVGRRGVERRVAEGRLRRLHRGVFLAGPLAGPRMREMAAVLAVGDGAVVSHRAAAVLWELLPARPGPVDVTVTHGHPRSRPGIRIHRTRDPDRTDQDGVPVTRPARTLLDLATVAAPRELVRAAEEAQVLRLVTPAHLARLRERPGAAALAAALGGSEPALTRSEAERRLLALVRAAGLPAPRTNVRVGRFEVDALWAEQRVIVEVDGFAAHGTRRAFERDRARDQALQAAGYRVIRVTWRQLVHEPAAVAATLAAVLRRPASVP